MSRVAIVHDWLTGMRGGEKCLAAFLRIYPHADIYTMVHAPGTTTDQIDERVKGTSWLQALPGVRRYYRTLLPFYPTAIRSIDLGGYDLVISLSHAAAKNVRVAPGATHISYCFTPMRYIWDQAEAYFGAMTPAVWPVINRLRAWDRAASRGVSHFAAISRFVAARIRCFYNRSADVIYPPVHTEWIEPIKRYHRGEAFLYAGALVPYKKVDLLVKAFNKMGHELWIAGTGPLEGKLKKMARSNIKFFGAVTDSELSDLYANCRALLFPAVEDFGLIPIECLAAGRPVIGMYAGALRESLNGIKPWLQDTDDSALAVEESCGVFIWKSSKNQVGAVESSVNYFMEHESRFLPEVCRKQAGLFSPDRFYSSWADLILKQESSFSRRSIPVEHCHHA